MTDTDTGSYRAGLGDRVDRTAGGPPAGTDDGGQSERGLTEIADRVVEKLAVRLASEVDGVAPGETVGGLRGALPGLRGGSATNAQAETGLRTARVALTMDVRYPHPAVEVTDHVRSHVIDGLRRFTGLEVDSLTITVRRLVASRPGRRRVE